MRSSLLTLFPTLTTFASCEARAWHPQLALYSAGYLGAMAPGIGIRTEGTFALSAHLLYGYVPPSLGGRHIHSASLELRAHSPGLSTRSGLTWHPLHLSLAGTRGFGPGLFWNSPKRYPPEYYPSTAFHSILGLGSEVVWGDVALSLGVAFLDTIVEARFMDRDWGRFSREGAPALSLHWRLR